MRLVVEGGGRSHMMLSVVGIKERWKKGKSKGKFICMFRSSTNFKASDLTFGTEKEQNKR